MHSDWNGMSRTTTQLADRPALRAELGYSPDQRVCLVTVGGSGVGADLLRRVIATFPEAKPWSRSCE
jgi:predicted glycosyltransferase